MEQTAKEKAWDEGAAWAKHKAQARIDELEAQLADTDALRRQIETISAQIVERHDRVAELERDRDEWKKEATEGRLTILRLRNAYALVHDRVAELEAEVRKERARSHKHENENRRLRTALSFALGEGE